MSEALLTEHYRRSLTRERTGLLGRGRAHRVNVGIALDAEHAEHLVYSVS